MRLSSGGYNTHQYDPAAFRKVVARVVKAIPVLLEETGADSVVVSGKSGQSVGFAALTQLDFNLVVVRKPNDSSHGCQVEGLDTFLKYIILDDFVASGDTVNRIVSTINECHEKARTRPWSPDDSPVAECVGVLECCKANLSDSMPYSYYRKVEVNAGSFMRYHCGGLNDN